MIPCLLLLAVLAPVPVPAGPCVLVNGILDADEWGSSVRIRLDAHAELRAHRDSRSLFLSVVSRDTSHSGVDLYVRCRDGLHMLHVSSALGERVLGPGGWSDTEWGRNRWWTANTVCVVDGEAGRQIVAPEAFEFQLARSRLGRETAVYLHLKRPERRLPPEATPDSPERWVRLTLAGP